MGIPTQFSLLLQLAILAGLGPIAPSHAFVQQHQHASRKHHQPSLPSTLLISPSSSSFALSNNYQCQRSSSRCSTPLLIMMMASRYGPKDDGILPPTQPIEENNSSNNKSQLKSQFSSLLHKLLNPATPEEEYPSIIASNIEMILNVLGYQEDTLTDTEKKKSSVEEEVVLSSEDGYKKQPMLPSLPLLEEIIYEEAVQSGERAIMEHDDSIGIDEISEAVSMILSFVETFVEQTSSMDNTYKQLLRKIFTSIAPGGSPETTADDAATTTTSIPSGGGGASALENKLDTLLSANAEAFTPGFLRHVEGECDRISSLKTLTPESTKMLQILRVIQARILEELGKGIGEGAIVLGQLLGYDNEAERLAVLDAGLAVRGLEFARELEGLTEEALEGFDRAMEAQPGSVDPELVKGVKSMDERIKKFIDRESSGGGEFQ